jgi:hypothetical protein
MTTAYDEIVEFIAGGTTPQSVVEFRPSEETKARVAELLRLHKSESLTPDESAELNHYLHVEHVMRLAKARARHRLQQG